jgi:hypothetical protein
MDTPTAATRGAKRQARGGAPLRHSAMMRWPSAARRHARTRRRAVALREQRLGSKEAPATLDDGHERAGGSGPARRGLTIGGS